MSFRPTLPALVLVWLASALLTMNRSARANEMCVGDWVKHELSSKTYDIQLKAASRRLHAWAQLENDGTLVLDLKTRAPDGKRIEDFRGSHEFAKIMRHFAGRVKRIQGHWVWGSDNLRALNAGLGRGLRMEEAVRETWTAKQAAKFGYTEITVLEAEGAPDRLTSARVRFSRPALTDPSLTTPAPGRR